MVTCPNCRYDSSDGARFCSNCGMNFTAAPGGPAPYPPPIYGQGYYNQPYYGYPAVQQKDPGIAAILALLAGVFGLMGMGHIYLGRIIRGLVILVGGIVLWSLAVFFLFAGVFGPTGILWIFSLVCVIAVLGLLVWQTYDAYALAKQYNEVVRRTGRAPW